ncbi:hypothetical protein ACET66_19865, partial [Aeromonas simiae]|uniref:hypothetical protein n=1 Tax=Aeromonas simiae TaxID=218936 RepID=UPI0038D1F9D5
DGVCERDKQTEHPGSACQTAPIVAVTRGWGSHDLLADLGNNAPNYELKHVSDSNQILLPAITTTAEPAMR